jgi:hypothetical protein
LDRASLPQTRVLSRHLALTRAEQGDMTSLAAADRLQALYDSTLKPRIEALEGLRRQVRWLTIKAIASVAIALAAGLALFDWLVPAWPNGRPLAGFIGVAAGIGFSFWRYGSKWYVALSNYEARYKREVVAEVFRIVVPRARYEPFQGLGSDVFNESALFRRHGEYASDDRVRGHIGATPFEMADVKRQYRGTRKTGLQTVFHGLFIHIAIGSTLRGTTIVQPRSVQSFDLGNRIELDVRTGLEQLSLENPAFEREFVVYTDDAIEAKRFVTAPLMERLLAQLSQSRHPVALSCKGTGIYIGVHYGRQLFEPRVATTTSFAAVREMADHFAIAELIVRQLDQRVLEGDGSRVASLPSAKDASTDHHSGVSTSGHMTEADFWNLPMPKLQEAEDEDSGTSH